PATDVVADGIVAEQRQVAGAAPWRDPGGDGSDQPQRRFLRQPVQVRGPRGLQLRPPRLLVGEPAQSVQHQVHDRAATALDDGIGESHVHARFARFGVRPGSVPGLPRSTYASSAPDSSAQGGPSSYSYSYSGRAQYGYQYEYEAPAAPDGAGPAGRH